MVVECDYLNLGGGSGGVFGHITPTTTKTYLTDVDSNAKMIVLWLGYNYNKLEPMVVVADFENETATRWYSSAWSTQAGTDMTSAWYNVSIGKDSGGVWFKAGDNYFGSYVNYVAY